jgi:hypothetical protein
VCEGKKISWFFSKGFRATMNRWIEPFSITCLE